MRTGKPLVECAVCGQSKCPLGRSAPMATYMCDFECEGYMQDPKPDSLWPNEEAEEWL